jgi:hypothetical protein
MTIYKVEFLAELFRMCESEPLPIMVGGDFNILRENNDNFNAHCPFVFI